jgi:hypothetical protein
MAAKFRTEQGFNIAGSVDIVQGSGAPEGAIIAGIGSFYMDSTNGIFYRKGSGVGNTGWVQLGDDGVSSAEDSFQNSFTGKTGGGDETPTYTSDNVVTQGGTLEAAIGELDAGLNTATLNTDTDISTNSWVLDEDDMTSDSATKVPTQQSVKAYVDAVLTSEMSYIGGYDADTNTPDLDTAPSGISKGDTYTITVAGTFFGTVLEVGDVIISEKADPTVEADWTVVQKDMDAGSIKTSYESNADTNAFTDADNTKLDGIEALADVTDATNVEAAGAVMESDSTTASMSFVVDEDDMTSDLATKVPTQQSVKAYVDTAIDTTVLNSELIQTSTGVSDAGKAIKLDTNGHIDASMINDADISLDNITEGATNLFYTAGDNTKLDGIEALADVTDATNVEAAGAVMESDSTTASMSFVVDEDNMVSDLATKVPTQQSVKAYVDTAIAPAYTKVNGTVAASSTTDVDNIASSGIVGVEWELVLYETATPANMYSCKVFAHTDGTTVDSVEYAVLELGTSPVVTVTVAINGSDLELRINSSVSSTYRITRREIQS